MEISVNGKATEIESDSTIAVLLVQLKMKPQYVAVERNLELIPRGEHAACRLEAGDAIEIVTLVGGG